jgi:hypothetical protein
MRHNRRVRKRQAPCLQCFGASRRFTPRSVRHSTVHSRLRARVQCFLFPPLPPLQSNAPYHANSPRQRLQSCPDPDPHSQETLTVVCLTVSTLRPPRDWSASRHSLRRCRSHRVLTHTTSRSALCSTPKGSYLIDGLMLEWLVTAGVGVVGVRMRLSTHSGSHRTLMLPTRHSRECTQSLHTAYPGWMCTRWCIQSSLLWRFAIPV